MNLKFWAPLACLTLFMMFAGTAFAQDADTSTPSPKVKSAIAAARASASAKPADATPKEQQKGSSVKSDADTCAYTFTNAGPNNSYMEFCVSTNGNIISFQSPSGIEYLDLGTLSEGYGICDFATGLFYYDYADYGASGFGAPTLVSHTATLVTIKRITTDGAWTLTQTISKVGGVTPYAKVEMHLENNSSEDKVAGLLRWADVDPYNAPANDNYLESFDSTYNSAWGYTSLGSYTGPDQIGYGLMIQNIGIPTGLDSASDYVLEGIDWSVNTAPAPLFVAADNPCTPFNHGPGYFGNVDGSVMIYYFLGIDPHHTATVNDRYLAL